MSEKNKIGFEDEKDEHLSLSDYSNEWVLIHSWGSNYVGKLVYVNGNDVALFPYQKADFREGIRYYSIEREGKPFGFLLPDSYGFRPYSEESSKNFCLNMNRKARLESMQEELAYRDLSEKLQARYDSERLKVVKR